MKLKFITHEVKSLSVVALFWMLPLYVTSTPLQVLFVGLGIAAAISSIFLIYYYEGLPMLFKRHKLLKTFLKITNIHDGEMNPNGTVWTWTSPETKRTVVLKRLPNSSGDGVNISAFIDEQALDLSPRDRFDIDYLFDCYGKGVSNDSLDKLAGTLDSMLFEQYEAREKELVKSLAEHRASSRLDRLEPRLEDRLEPIAPIEEPIQELPKTTPKRRASRKKDEITA